MKTVEVKTGGKRFEAELADNFLSRARGLSFRKKGKMLFSFPGATRAKIDMMFLSKTLYLYFMDLDKQVIDVQSAEPWGWNPKTWRLYSPDQKYTYLLESFEKLEIREGDRPEFEI